ncbi:N-acetyltransferase B complex non catalytic subunit-domain-containing protein [Fimicolochytrium jonesii]|uniref:N-acetyltransferase B complex non catalytic subunit-domain-containing protein n=1 Tax=Fimicolochytrium jonesii TaxID=1396493 RepID=UPI0022FF4235|nr:N-acetyltransferase B complex non catalytic subunit-domain-containing protein [Fimicolochytrium jonesii]KAI8820831.1 N-acetyltransferase B complex non catalytic subunit-domain-containing protein [Fimicolochytrium jonesii]
MSSITDVSEWKLRPIYEALDSYSNKQAISLCNKHLKKQPNALILKALKAIALDRSGRDDEALELCDEVKKGDVSDEAILQAIVMVYRGHGRHADIIEVYKNAYAKAPKNEELANHWFMALVRADDRSAMQQAAMKIQKQFKDNRYMFWTIMSLWLQAKPGSAGPDLSLTLTERMLAKAAQEKRITDYEALQLYLEVLEKQGKHAEALQIAQGELGNLCKVDADRKRIIVRLAKAAKEWSTVRSVSKELLLANPDDWLSYCDYIAAFIELLPVEDRNPDSVQLTQFRDLISVLQSKGSSDKHVKRGPYLGELELEKALLSLPNSKFDTTHISELIGHYLARFGATLSCFDDLKPYLELLQPGSIDQSAVISEQGEDSKPVDKIRRRVNLEKIRRYTSKKLSVEETAAIVGDYLRAYKESIPIGKDLDKRELQPGDDYVLLVAHYLLDIFQNDRDNRALLAQIAAVLEYGLQRSEWNYQIRLLLVRVYFELGVHQRISEIVNVMSIKQVQHDTLSFFYTDDLEYLGCPDTALRALLKTTTIHHSNERETPEMIVQAFKFGTYSKIPEFIRFRNRLRNSIQRTVSQKQLYRVETLRRFPDRADFAEYLDGLDQATLKYSDADIDQLSDNRDVKLLSNWGGAPVADVVRGATFPRDRRTWLKLNALIPLILRGLTSGGAKPWEEHHKALRSVLDSAKSVNQDADELASAELLYTISQAHLDAIGKDAIDFTPLSQAVASLKGGLHECPY